MSCILKITTTLSRRLRTAIPSATITAAVSWWDSVITVSGTSLRRICRAISLVHTGGKVRNPNGPGWGWPAKDGGVWIPSPKMDGGEGWTIQYPGGGHSHAYPGGGVRNHFELEQSTGRSIIMIFSGAAATIYLIANDITGFGVADDPWLAGSMACFVAGVNGLIGKKVCTECGEVKYGY